MSCAGVHAKTQRRKEKQSIKKGRARKSASCLSGRINQWALRCGRLHESEIGVREVCYLRKHINEIRVGKTEPACERRRVLFDRSRRDPSSPRAGAVVRVVTRAKSEMRIRRSVSSVHSVEVRRRDTASDYELMTSPRVIGSDCRPRSGWVHGPGEIAHRELRHLVLES